MLQNQARLPLQSDRGHMHAALAAREHLPQAPLRLFVCPGCGRYHHATHAGVCVNCQRPRS